MLSSSTRTVVFVLEIGSFVCRPSALNVVPRGGDVGSTHDAEEVVVRDPQDALRLLDGVLEPGLSDLRPVRAAQRFRLT